MRESLQALFSKGLLGAGEELRGGGRSALPRSSERRTQQRGLCEQMPGPAAQSPQGGRGAGAVDRIIGGSVGQAQRPSEKRVAGWHGTHRHTGRPPAPARLERHPPVCSLVRWLGDGTAGAGDCVMGSTGQSGDSSSPPENHPSGVYLGLLVSVNPPKTVLPALGRPCPPLPSHDTGDLLTTQQGARRGAPGDVCVRGSSWGLLGQEAQVPSQRVQQSLQASLILGQ